jgi:ACR3 family arsenite efflux pump ArsB
MWNLLAYIQKKLIWFVLGAMLLGLANGYFFPSGYLKLLVIPLTILMVYPMMASMNLGAVFTQCSLKLQLLTQGINFIFMPLFTFALGWIFFPGDPTMAFGLLLIGLLPTSGMTISWTGFAKGNTQVAVKMTIIGLILGIILTPFFGYVLMGRAISIPFLKTVKQISLVVVIPLVLGALTQLALKRGLGTARFNRDIKPFFPRLSLLGVVGIIFVAMSLKARTILADPWQLAVLAVPLVLLYAVNYSLISYLGRRFFSREDGIALVFGTVMRNLSIALAIAVTVFDEAGARMAMIISLAYIIQIKSAAIYVKFAGKFFGPAPEDRVSDVVTEGIFSLDKSKTLQDAARLLDEEHIHAVAVLDENDSPLGILSSEDLINQIAEDRPLDTPLSEVELQSVSTCSAASPLREVISKMKRTHQYKFLVTDGDGKPTGLLSSSDIIGRVAQDKNSG